MQKPLVSIVIRSMDRPTLIDAMNTAARQDYPFVELVVVNAKGLAHTKVAKRRDGRRVVFVDGERALHRSTAANRGLEAARGDWLMFLDDDDYLASDHVSNLIETARKAGSPAVYSHCRAVDGDGNALDHLFDETYDPTKLLAGNFFPIHAVLFARTLIDDETRFDEALDRFEDWDFWLQLSQKTDFVMAPKATALYRISGDTGFGLNAKSEHIQENALKLATKWRQRTTPDRFFQLMELARQHRYMEALLKKLEGQGLRLIDPKDASERIPQELTDQQRRLADTERKARSLADEYAEVRAELAVCRNNLERIRRSSSWRLTAPLRSAIHWFRFGR